MDIGFGQKIVCQREWFIQYVDTLRSPNTDVLRDHGALAPSWFLVKCFTNTRAPLQPRPRLALCACDSSDVAHAMSSPSCKLAPPIPLWSAYRYTWQLNEQSIHPSLHPNIHTYIHPSIRQVYFRQ